MSALYCLAPGKIIVGLSSTGLEGFPGSRLYDLSRQLIGLLMTLRSSCLRAWQAGLLKRLGVLLE